MPTPLPSMRARPSPVGTTTIARRRTRPSAQRRIVALRRVNASNAPRSTAMTFPGTQGLSFAAATASTIGTTACEGAMGWRQAPRASASRRLPRVEDPRSWRVPCPMPSASSKRRGSATVEAKASAGCLPMATVSPTEAQPAGRVAILRTRASTSAGPSNRANSRITEPPRTSWSWLAEWDAGRRRATPSIRRPRNRQSRRTCRQGWPRRPRDRRRRSRRRPS